MAEQTFTSGDRVTLARFSGRPKGTVLGRVPPRHYYVIVRRDDEFRPIVCVPEELEPVAAETKAGE